MKECKTTSFLKRLSPETYYFLQFLKPAALWYGVLLGVMALLSVFFQSSIIAYFLNIMMGWSIVAILFTGVVVIALDKEYEVEEDDPDNPAANRYKQSRIWGITLLILGLAALFLSNSYKQKYNFQCESFYLEPSAHLYHIREDCAYIGENEDMEDAPHSEIVEVKGKDLEDTNHELCIACKEWAEDVGHDIYTH